MTDVFNADTDTDCVILLIMTTDTDTALCLRGVCEMSVVTLPDQLTILTRWPKLHSHQPHPPLTPAAHFRPGPILKLLDRQKIWPDRALHCCTVGLVLFRKTQINSADVIGDHPLVLAWAWVPGPSSLLPPTLVSLNPQTSVGYQPPSEAGPVWVTTGESFKHSALIGIRKW